MFFDVPMEKRNVTQVLTMRGPNKQHHNHIQIGASKGVPVHVWTKNQSFFKMDPSTHEQIFFEKENTFIKMAN